MSPEQVEGDPRAVDTRCDVYGLGAILYELLTGRSPLDLAGLAPPAAIARLLSESPPPPRALNASLPRDLDTIVAKALERDPERRYATATELRTDLESFLSGRPIQARRHGPVYVARKWVARHRVLTIVAVTAAVAAGALLWQAHVAERDKTAQAMALARSWLDQTLAMARTVGARAHRRSLVESLMDSSAKFLERSPRDARALDIRAAVMAEMGDVELEDGHAAAAADLFRQVLEIRRRLLNPVASDDGLMDLSIALVRVGDVAKETGDRDTARVYYGQAMDID